MCATKYFRLFHFFLYLYHFCLQRFVHILKQESDTITTTKKTSNISRTDRPRSCLPEMIFHEDTNLGLAQVTTGANSTQTAVREAGKCTNVNSDAGSDIDNGRVRARRGCTMPRLYAFSRREFTTRHNNNRCNRCELVVDSSFTRSVCCLPLGSLKSKVGSCCCCCPYGPRCCC